MTGTLQCCDCRRFPQCSDYLYVLCRKEPRERQQRNGKERLWESEYRTAHHCCDHAMIPTGAFLKYWGANQGIEDALSSPCRCGRLANDPAPGIILYYLCPVWDTVRYNRTGGCLANNTQFESNNTRTSRGLVWQRCLASVYKRNVRSA